MDNKDILDKIFADDDLGLLNEKVKVTQFTEDERVIESFKKIESFIAENGREPERNPANMSEFKLAARLKSFQEAPSVLHSLHVCDSLNLLPPVPIKTDIEDILSDDTFLSLFSEESNNNDIFTLKHVKSIEKRAEADFVAKRKPCKDFSKYEDGFKKVHEELESGERVLVKYENQELIEGEYYIHNGILFLFEQKQITQEEGTINGKRKRKDGRTRCVFENGTESNMRYRSVAKSLYSNGAIVSHEKGKVIPSTLQAFVENMKQKTDSDTNQTGYIYILKSLSTDPYIATTKNLYKIGFCTSTVEERIKNAEYDPTFLLAPVKIVAEYDCKHINTQKLEKLLHDFFNEARMDVHITSKNKDYDPREWFALPLMVICKALEIITQDLVNNTDNITQFYYDKENERLGKL